MKKRSANAIRYTLCLELLRDRRVVSYVVQRDTHAKSDDQNHSLLFRLPYSVAILYANIPSRLWSSVLLLALAAALLGDFVAASSISFLGSGGRGRANGHVLRELVDVFLLLLELRLDG